MALNFLCFSCGGRGVRREEDADKDCTVCVDHVVTWETGTAAPLVVTQWDGKPLLSSPVITGKKIAAAKKARSKRKVNGDIRDTADMWDLRDGDVD